MQINFLKYKKVFFALSLVLVVISLSFLFGFGLSQGIDFTGGSIIEIEYLDNRPANNEIKEKLSSFDLGEVYVQQTGSKGAIIKMKEISEDTHQKVLSRLGEMGDMEELRFELIGPVIGKELKEKTTTVAILSLIVIVLYIALAFRKLSWPAKSWQYGIASLFALFHDVLIPLGVFAFLGKYYGVQITIPVVVAFLTILGYSINNTVVVFDRIRENLLKRTIKNYEEVVNVSLNQTLARSINTSLTTLFVLLAIFLLGGETLKYFSLALMLGIVAGTYSSLFLASPLLAAWLRRRGKI